MVSHSLLCPHPPALLTPAVVPISLTGHASTVTAPLPDIALDERSAITIFYCDLCMV